MAGQPIRRAREGVPPKQPPRGYSWPPFEPGHELSLKHGAFQPKRVQPRAAEYVEGLLELAGQPESPIAYLLDPSYRMAIARWAQVEAQIDLISEWLAAKAVDGSPLLDTGEEVRPAANMLMRYDWTGELAGFSLTVVALADVVAPTRPELAARLAAIAGSDAIASAGITGMIGAPGFEKLTAAVEGLGAQRLESERSQASSLSYGDAMAFVFETIDRLIDDNTNA